MRRHAAALLGCAILLAAASPARPPPAPTGRVSDTYFGKTIADPYRWMEAPPTGAGTAEFDRWARAQDAFTRAALDRIPGRDAMRRHMDDIAAHMTVVTAVTPVGHRVFFRRQEPGDDLARLVMRDTDTGRDRVLLDPNRVMIGGRRVAIDQFQPSQDGHYLAIGIAPAGSDDDVLAILDADTGRRLPDTIGGVRAASISWLPDGQSFFYNRLRPPGLHDAPPGHAVLQDVFMHRLGTDAGWDTPVFGAGINGITTIGPTDLVAVAAIMGTRTVLGIQNDGVSADLTLYVATIPEAPGATPAGPASTTTDAGSHKAGSPQAGGAQPSSLRPASPSPGTNASSGDTRGAAQRGLTAAVGAVGARPGSAWTWRRIATAADGIVDVAAGRDELYFRSHQDAPRYKIVAVPLNTPGMATARTVVPQQGSVLTNIAVSADALYVAGRNGAASYILRVGADRKPALLKLPVQGSIAGPGEGPGSLTADPRTPGVIAGIGTWVSPTEYFSFDRTMPGDVRSLDLAPGPPAAGTLNAAGGYLVTETTAPAKDGRTRLPLSIIERKGTPRDHNRPVLVEGYGAFGLSEEPRPAFVPAVRAWVDAGGVMAIAHVRGGGELGEDWHQAGRKVTKQNSIHDFIDCAWYMTSLGYASDDTLAGTGTGAGGITVAGAITQIPSLFRAALIRNGAVNPLRGEFTAAGAANTAEFGTVGVQADFNALLAMDPTQHLKPGTPYPAVLLTGGAQDPHVPLWQPAKLAARLQAAGSRAKGPTLLRVDAEGSRTGQAQTDAEWADGFAFLLWQMGVQGYQPVK